MGEKSKKEKKAKKESVEADAPSVDLNKHFLSPIARPLADDKLCKKVGLSKPSVLWWHIDSQMKSSCMQVLKLVKKAAKRKQVKRGVKEVIKAVRKKTQGCVFPWIPSDVFIEKLLQPCVSLVFRMRVSVAQALWAIINRKVFIYDVHLCCSVCIIAGDISPIDVVTPIPVLCEDNDIPYIYVPSKEILGQSGLTKRPTSCMLILPKPVKGDIGNDDESKEFTENYKEVFNKVKAVQTF